VKIFFKRDVRVHIFKNNTVIVDKTIKFKKLESSTTDSIEFSIDKEHLARGGCCLFGGRGVIPEENGTIKIFAKLHRAYKNPEYEITFGEK